MGSDRERPSWWGDWRAQLRHAVRTPEALERALDLTAEELTASFVAHRSGLPTLIPPYYLGLIDGRNPNCPIRRQCVALPAESRRSDGDRRDPLGEEDHEVAPRLVQRYPDRALLLVTSTCAVHCRFCTRSRLVSVEQGFVPSSVLEPAFDWLEQHPEVREVLVSGGDPLVASSKRLSLLLNRLRRIRSIEVIRIGTRVPVVLPMRIDAELVAVLRRHSPIWVMTHFNHPRELTAESEGALARLVDGGLPVMNQTVLLRGVNDDETTLTELFRALVRNRVRPYYLLHADVVEGTGHMRTALSRSIELFSRLQGRLSGIALPKLVVDTPGGLGKVPVGPDTLVSQSPGMTVLRTFRGVEVSILDPEDALR